MRASALALALVAATISLAGCTPAGLTVFGNAARPEDRPPDFARSILPTTVDDDYRLLGTVGTDTYYAAVLVGSDFPWCLLRVEQDGTASAACSADPHVVTYSSGSIVALSDDAPDESHDGKRSRPTSGSSLELRSPTPPVGRRR
jgi:hypothetical protein